MNLLKLALAFYRLISSFSLIRGRLTRMTPWLLIGLTGLSLTETGQANHSYGDKILRPKLVLVLVIDQFRADFLTRFGDKFLPTRSPNGVGGFKYLMNQSAYFPFAQYDILQSITAPGHATIATGSYPYLSGIVGNDWYNKKTLRSEYCVEDPGSPLIRGQRSGIGKNDSTGRSPRNLNGSTLSDEIRNTLKGARVYTVALKDRAAILMGGKRANLALWFDPSSRSWVSSEYYLKDQALPGWVQKLNEQTVSTLSSDAAALQLDLDSDPNYWNKGTELTVLAAEAALKELDLGKGPQTDFLGVSFSMHDIVGHHTGPYSAEVEKLTLQEDRAFSRLLNTIDHRLGLKNVLIAFSADHGVSPSPEWASSHGFESARLGEKEIRERISTKLDQKFGKPKTGTWVTTSFVLNFHLNRSAIEEKGLELKTVEDAAKKALLEEEGIQYSFTGTDFIRRELPASLLERQILHTYYPSRSGDVMGILKPFYITGRLDAPRDTASHMTGYSYDRSVPLLISGRYVRPGIYANRAEVVDLAPTLAFLMGVLPPALSEGRVLSEALDLR